MIWMLPAIFVVVSSPAGEHVRSYEGQSEETAQSLLRNEGKTGRFITQKEYQERVDAGETGISPDPVFEQAKRDFLDKTKTTEERLDALSKVLELDNAATSINLVPRL